MVDSVGVRSGMNMKCWTENRIWKWKTTLYFGDCVCLVRISKSQGNCCNRLGIVYTYIQCHMLKFIRVKTKQWSQGLHELYPTPIISTWFTVKMKKVMKTRTTLTPVEPSWPSTPPWSTSWVDAPLMRTDCLRAGLSPRGSGPSCRVWCLWMIWLGCSTSSSSCRRLRRSMRRKMVRNYALLLFYLFIFLFFSRQDDNIDWNVHTVGFPHKSVYLSWKELWTKNLHKFIERNERNREGMLDAIEDTKRKQYYM